MIGRRRKPRPWSNTAAATGWGESTFAEIAWDKSRGAATRWAVFGAFVGVLIGWTLLARLVRLLVHATPLTLIDRTLGAAFGLARGGVLLLALATLVAFTPAARSQPWQDSQGAAWLRVALQGIKPVLPAEVARYL